MVVAQLMHCTSPASALYLPCWNLPLHLGTYPPIFNSVSLFWENAEIWGLQVKTVHFSTLKKNISWRPCRQKWLRIWRNQIRQYIWRIKVRGDKQRDKDSLYKRAEEDRWEQSGARQASHRWIITQAWKDPREEELFETEQDRTIKIKAGGRG